MVPVEPMSLSIGVVALASLFTDCVECFEYIDTARSFGRDGELLITLFEVEKSRFLIWADTMGILQTDTSTRSSKIDSHLFRPVIERILNCIRLLFTDVSNLTSRYGLVQSTESSKAMDSRGSQTYSMAQFKSSFSQFRDRLDHSQRQIPLAASVKWAIQDRTKFATFVEDLHRFIDGLDNITSTAETALKRKQLTKQDVTSLQERVDLGVLIEATAQVNREWSDLTTEAFENSILGDKHIQNWLETTSSKDDTGSAAQSIHSLPVAEPLSLEQAHTKDLTIKETFVANVSEELLIPLNGIMGLCAVMMAEKDISKIHVVLNTVYKTSNLLFYMVKDLIDFSTGVLQPAGILSNLFDFENLPQKLFSIFRDQALKEELQLVVQYGPGHPYSTLSTSDKSVSRTNVLPKEVQKQTFRLWGDESRLLQVIMKLVSNSIRFTPKGGKVMVKIDWTQGHNALAALQSDFGSTSEIIGPEAITLAIVVSDNGVGIPKDKQHVIFEPFNHHSKNISGHSGLGLGLAICKEIVEAMHGIITVESGPGEGSIFCVKIPLWLMNSKETQPQSSATVPDAISSQKDGPSSSKFRARLSALFRNK